MGMVFDFIFSSYSSIYILVMELEANEKKDTTKKQ